MNKLLFSLRNTIIESNDNQIKQIEKLSKDQNLALQTISNENKKSFKNQQEHNDHIEKQYNDIKK